MIGSKTEAGQVLWVRQLVAQRQQLQVRREIDI